METSKVWHRWIESDRSSIKAGVRRYRNGRRGETLTNRPFTGNVAMIPEPCVRQRFPGYSTVTL